jgi:phenol/toluene 2-monooxygenase (NADH) P0/A0
MSSFDVANARRYVRVTGIRKNAFVEFDFAIDDPAIFIELVLPFSQFETFCKKNKVCELTAEEKTRVDLDKLKWRYGQPGVDH